MRVEEINKAYECCKDSFHRHCDGCPVTDDCCHDKMPLFVLRYALELLKEQQAEIEQLRNDANARRCKDCKNKECWGRTGNVVCGIDGTPHRPDWFCADFDPSDEAVLEAFAEDG